MIPRPYDSPFAVSESSWGGGRARAQYPLDQIHPVLWVNILTYGPMLQKICHYDLRRQLMARMSREIDPLEWRTR